MHFSIKKTLIIIFKTSIVAKKTDLLIFGQIYFMRFFRDLFKTPALETKRHPIPVWRPNTPNDINRIMDTAKGYANSKYQMAVFKYGTVVSFLSPVVDIEAEDKKKLELVYETNAKYHPVKMADGNFTIQYSKAALTIVFKDEIKEYWPYIEKNFLAGICKDEAALHSKGRRNVIDQVGKIYLFSRAKMFMDAQDPKVVKIFDPLVGR